MSLIDTLKAAARAALRHRLFAPLVARLLARRLRLLHDSSRPDALNVLVFSAARWRQDLEALARPGGLRLYAIDQSMVGRIASLFRADGREPAFFYHLEEDPEILRLRREHIAFLERVVASLKRLAALDCAISPSAIYKQEKDWAIACDAVGLPFVGLHKEYTVLDDSQIAERVENYRNSRQTFVGTHMGVTNETAKRLFALGGVTEEDKMTVIGLLRMDNLFAADSPYRRPPDDKPRVVTLFSFGHFSGGIASPERRSQLFSKNDDFGFVTLFRDVHAGFADLARRYPDVEFLIKPKSVAPWWVAEIENVVEQELGVPFSKIPNCRIVGDDAPDLIARSTAVVGFNSTVLLESLVLGRPTIVPYFAEAEGDYASYVYFRDFVDAFSVARSRDDMKGLVERALSGEQLPRVPRQRLSEMCRFYLGFDDGETAMRAERLLHEVVANRTSSGRGRPALGEAA